MQQGSDHGLITLTLVATVLCRHGSAPTRATTSRYLIISSCASRSPLVKRKSSVIIIGAGYCQLEVMLHTVCLVSLLSEAVLAENFVSHCLSASTQFIKLIHLQTRPGNGVKLLKALCVIQDQGTTSPRGTLSNSA